MSTRTSCPDDAHGERLRGVRAYAQAAGAFELRLVEEGSSGWRGGGGNGRGRRGIQRYRGNG